MRFEMDSGASLSTSAPELLADILPRVVRRLAQPAGSMDRPLGCIEGSCQRLQLPQSRKLAACGYGGPGGGRDCSK